MQTLENDGKHWQEMPKNKFLQEKVAGGSSFNENGLFVLICGPNGRVQQKSASEISFLFPQLWYTA